MHTRNLKLGTGINEVKCEMQATHAVVAGSNECNARYTRLYVSLVCDKKFTFYARAIRYSVPWERTHAQFRDLMYNSREI